MTRPHFVFLLGPKIGVGCRLFSAQVESTDLQPLVPGCDCGSSDRNPIWGSTPLSVNPEPTKQSEPRVGGWVGGTSRWGLTTFGTPVRTKFRTYRCFSAQKHTRSPMARTKKGQTRGPESTKLSIDGRNPTPNRWFLPFNPNCRNSETRLYLGWC